MTDARLPRWEHFHHGADIGVRGLGRSPAEAFEQAALALTAVMLDPAQVKPRRRVPIEARAPDLELLLVDWLAELVYKTATQGLLFARYAVELSEGAAGEALLLRAQAWGEPLDPDRHRPAVEVKGVTYTELRVVEEAPGRWLAQCVVDV